MRYEPWLVVRDKSGVTKEPKVRILSHEPNALCSFGCPTALEHDLILPNKNLHHMKPLTNIALISKDCGYILSA